MNNDKKLNEEIKQARFDMKFALFCAKFNNCMSKGAFFLGTAMPVAGLVNTCANKNSQNPAAGFLMGLLGFFVLAISARTSLDWKRKNLRDYVNARNKYVQLEQQHKQKSK